MTPRILLLALALCLVHGTWSADATEPPEPAHSRVDPTGIRHPTGNPTESPTNLREMIADAKRHSQISPLLAKTSGLTRREAEQLFSVLKAFWGNHGPTGWDQFVAGVLDGDARFTNKGVVTKYLDYRFKGIVGTPIDALIRAKNGPAGDEKTAAQWEWDRRVEVLEENINQLGMRVDEAVALQYYAAIAIAPDAKLTDAQKLERTSVAFPAIASAIRRQGDARLDDLKTWMTAFAGNEEKLREARDFSLAIANAIDGYRTARVDTDASKPWTDWARFKYEVATAKTQYETSRASSGSRPGSRAHDLLLAGFEVQGNGATLVPRPGAEAARARLQLAREFGDDINGAFGQLHQNTNVTINGTRIDNLGQVYRAAVAFARTEPTVEGTTTTASLQLTDSSGRPLELTVSAPVTSGRPQINVGNVNAAFNALGSQGVTMGEGQTTPSFVQSRWNGMTVASDVYDERREPAVRNSALEVRRRNGNFSTVTYETIPGSMAPGLITTTVSGSTRRRSWTDVLGRNVTETATGSPGNWTVSTISRVGMNGNTQTTITEAITNGRPSTITTVTATRTDPTAPLVPSSTTTETITYGPAPDFHRATSTVQTRRPGQSFVAYEATATYENGVEKTRVETVRTEAGAGTVYNVVYSDYTVNLWTGQQTRKVTRTPQGGAAVVTTEFFNATTNQWEPLRDT